MMYDCAPLFTCRGIVYRIGRPVETEGRTLGERARAPVLILTPAEADRLLEEVLEKVVPDGLPC